MNTGQFFLATVFPGRNKTQIKGPVLYFCHRTEEEGSIFFPLGKPLGVGEDSLRQAGLVGGAQEMEEVKHWLDTFTVPKGGLSLSLGLLVCCLIGSN